MLGEHDLNPDKEKLLKIKGIEILGFVKHLNKIFESVAISVVPIIHHTGLITRVLDSISAGVPVISTAKVFKTINGFIPGKHGIAASSKDEYITSILELFNNKNRRLELSNEGKSLAKSHPTWKESVHKAERIIQSELEKRK